MQRRLAIKAPILLTPSQPLPVRPFSSIPARYGPPPPPPPPDDNTRSSGLVKSFLYGTEKGQELQREMEQSFSKILARGKYVHKLNQHHVRPDKIEEYVALMYSPKGSNLI
jgi:hypothetical protein